MPTGTAAEEGEHFGRAERGRGIGSRGGKRRHCYDVALGEAREVVAKLEVAAAIGYLPSVDAGLRRQLTRSSVRW
jgi:hypothetical protein